jgi:hypothetical protein
VHKLYFFLPYTALVDGFSRTIHDMKKMYPTKHKQLNNRFERDTLHVVWNPQSGYYEAVVEADNSSWRYDS